MNNSLKQKKIFLFIIFLILNFPFISVLAADIPLPEKSPNWASDSVNLLSSKGIKIPDWVDYESLVSQKDYAILLAKVTQIKDQNTFGDLDKNGFNKPLSRALAFDAALRAFGLKSKMEAVASKYQSKFTDITTEHIYYQALLTAEILKLTSGYPDKTFRPDDLLKWSEAVAIIESVHRWVSLMPETTPFQKAEDQRKYRWYYFIDIFRLVLTALYSLIAVFFLYFSWHKSRKEGNPLKPIVSSLIFATLFLSVMWFNEILYSREWIDKSIYYIISTISVLAGIFLLRTSVLVSKQTDPKPKANIEVGYVDFVDLGRGEMFVIDSVSKRRILTLISKNTKIYNKENRLLGKAFFSEIKPGDFVSIKGTEQINGGAIVSVDQLLLIASKQEAPVRSKQNNLINEDNQVVTRYKRVR